MCASLCAKPRKHTYPFSQGICSLTGKENTWGRGLGTSAWAESMVRRWEMVWKPRSKQNRRKAQLSEPEDLGLKYTVPVHWERDGGKIARDNYVRARRQP